jgi:hypothetical protein
MSALRSIKVRATDASHLELLRPLEHMPSGEFEMLVPGDEIPATPAAGRSAAFKAWAARPRPSIGLPSAGRGVIYAD